MFVFDVDTDLCSSWTLQLAADSFVDMDFIFTEVDSSWQNSGYQANWLGNDQYN